MERHFATTGAINIKEGRAGETGVFLKQTQRLAILSKSGQKPCILFSRKLNHAQLCDHDRPAENGTDREEKEDEFAGNGSVLKGEEQAAGRNQVRNGHCRVTFVSNNGFRKKRKR
jgi:hypothetical protein